jgi:hypothetical protein
MSSKLLLVTPPDDTVEDGTRLLLINLTEEQSQIVSSALLTCNLKLCIISYVWNSYDSVNWLFDKKHKSQLIIFNADSVNSLITGYMAAHPNSYYFGNLKDLHVVNKRVLYTVQDITTLIEETVNKNG